MPESYNLLTEPWIPVLRVNGRAGSVGIQEALVKAGEIRQITASNPMDNAALLRLLLAVLQWCKPEPMQGELDMVRQSGGIPQNWLNRLVESDNAKWFDLLAREGGFYQDRFAWMQIEEQAKKKAANKAKKEREKKAKRKRASTEEKSPDPEQAVEGIFRPATDLLQELPSGSNVAHFRHTRDFQNGLCPACCAVGLVRLSAFASASAHGSKQQKPAGINGATPVYAIPLGTTLLNTVLLNWPLQVVGSDGLWYEKAAEPAAQKAGPMRAFTWQPRCVWLERPSADQQEGTCCACGQDARLVNRIAFLPGWKRPFEKKPWPDDPHVLNVQSPTSKKSAPEPDSFPNPPQSIYVHARSWRTTCLAVLQRSTAETKAKGPIAVVCTGPASNKALYQDAKSLNIVMPFFDESRRDIAVQELNSINKIDLHRLLKVAIPRIADQRPELRSVVAMFSAPGERTLQRAFQLFLDQLSGSEPGQVEAVVARWRQEIKDRLAKWLSDVHAAAAVGSPLTIRAQKREIERVFARAFQQSKSQASGIGDQSESAAGPASEPTRRRKKKGGAT